MKWEYKQAFDLDEKSLNKIGFDGWELVSVTAHRGSYIKNFTEYIFKRLLQ